MTFANHSIYPKVSALLVVCLVAFNEPAPLHRVGSTPNPESRCNAA